MTLLPNVAHQRWSSVSCTAARRISLRPSNDMQFLQALRDRIRRGEITTTVRLWQRPHVKVGGRYALPPGEIVVTRIFEVSLAEITPELARASGFAGVVDLLKVAKHGPGRRVFVIEFRYEASEQSRRVKAASASRGR